MGPARVQFILVSSNDPEEATGSAPRQRTLAHSHAARSAHAKARRLRTIQYQAQKNLVKQGGLVGSSVEEKPLKEHPKTQLITILSANRKDPFTSFATSLKPMEEMLFDHYVTVIIPLMRCDEPTPEFTQRMTNTWVPLARSDASLLDITFLLSCRHLSASYTQSRQEPDLTQRALHYKNICLKKLRDAISYEAPCFTDSTVAKAIMLAYDELFVHDVEMLKHHMEGACKMVALKGGPESLGLDGLLQHLLFKLLSKGIKEVDLELEDPSDILSSRGACEAFD
ncbi:hypothetical protein F1880_004762 [Penicillium rolfsii]|nr:hypothetical protein F1880_004762 [Penicillium rolfsii]